MGRDNWKESPDRSRNRSRSPRRQYREERTSRRDRYHQDPRPEGQRVRHKSWDVRRPIPERHREKAESSRAIIDKSTSPPKDAKQAKVVSTREEKAVTTDSMCQTEEEHKPRTIIYREVATQTQEMESAPTIPAQSQGPKEGTKAEPPTKGAADLPTGTTATLAAASPSSSSSSSSSSGISSSDSPASPSPVTSRVTSPERDEPVKHVVITVLKEEATEKITPLKTPKPNPQHAIQKPEEKKQSGGILVTAQHPRKGKELPRVKFETTLPPGMKVVKIPKRKKTPIIRPIPPPTKAVKALDPLAQTIADLGLNMTEDEMEDDSTKAH